MQKSGSGTLGARGVRPLVKDSLGPTPERVACTDAYDNSLWAWRWLDGDAWERGELPEDEPSMLGWSGADTPLVSVEEIFTYDDDWDDFG